MKLSRRFVLAVTVSAIATHCVPCGLAQDAAASGQVTPALSGSGNAGRIVVWKNSTTLGNSVISQASGSVGIGTTAPAATLEVNGNAQVDGNFSLSGGILWEGRYCYRCPAERPTGTPPWVSALCLRTLQGVA